MKHLNSKRTLLIGALLIAAFLFSHLCNIPLTNDLTIEENDIRIRTALYQAISSSIPNSNPRIKKTAPATYEIPFTSSFSPQKLEAAIAYEFEKNDLPMDLDLGMIDIEEDSLIYGNRIYAGSKISSNIQTVHSGNNKLVIQLSKHEKKLMAGLESWHLLLLLSIFITLFLYSKRRFPNAFPYLVFKRVFSKRMIRNFQNQSSTKTIGRFKYDQKNLLLIHPTGERQLTYKEGRLLSFFLNQPNTLLERKQILNHVWEEDGFFVARSMDVFISRLRKYLSLESNIKIDNVRGVGYMLKF